MHNREVIVRDVAREYVELSRRSLRYLVERSKVEKGSIVYSELTRRYDENQARIDELFKEGLVALRGLVRRGNFG
ncbi:MAG: hypothetical protein AABW79_02515 [Nanoarchaeota archaeon]